MTSSALLPAGRAAFVTPQGKAEAFVCLVGRIVMLSTQPKQRVGDLLAKTIVVHTAR